MKDCQPPTHRLRNSRRLTAVLACGLALVLSGALIPAHADPLVAARRLLDASAAAEQFQRRTARQADAIIRHYEVIVATSADATLPRAIREAIADCYATVYHWDNFADGVASILAGRLTPHQMGLLTDFYQSRGLPPYEIDAFKATIAMAKEIELASAEFMLATSDSCVEHDARLIMGFLRARSGPIASD